MEASVRARKTGIWVASLAVLATAGGLIFVTANRVGLVRSLTGVVLIQNADPAKQAPVANVKVTLSARTGSAEAITDVSGLFHITLREGVWRGETIKLSFERDGYLPVRQTQRAYNSQLDVVRLSPQTALVTPVSAQPEAALSDIRVRYLAKGATTTEVGSLVRTFQVVNRGDAPCDGQLPCSPDGKWKAAMGGLKVDAGENQEFRNTRVSCIAGPCPFTHIDTDGFSQGGRIINVSVRDWSDTTTFLVEAEVMRTVASDVIRQAYPAIFGRIISFTLPAGAQGPSFEAELNGQEITFPLGPDLLLSWANCTLKIESDQTKLYSCELKPGFRMRS